MLTRLTSILRYLWDGLGGQMTEFSFTFKLPAQIALVLIAAGLAALGLSLCNGGEVVNGPYLVPP